MEAIIRSTAIMFMHHVTYLKISTQNQIRRIVSALYESEIPLVKSTLNKLTVCVLILRRRCVVIVMKRLLMLLIALGLATFIHERYVTSIEKRFLYRSIKNVHYLETKECILPDIDPFDERWKKYFFKMPPIVCDPVQPFLTYVDEQGNIRINASGAKEYGFHEKEASCSYSYIHRLPHDDFNISFTRPIAFKTSDKLKEPFVRVQCFEGRNQKMIYETAHAFVPPMTPELSARVRRGSPLQPSVLLLGLDSTSRLNFIRQLPKTYALLREQIKAVEFKGIVKVGLNTYPNMLAMLAGYVDSGDHMGASVPVWDKQFNTKTEFYDRLPAIWHNFSANGYVTMYAEDAPEFNMFDFMKKGFDQPPTDYYMRPFWLAMESFKVFRSRNIRCYQNFLNYVYLLNYTSEFVHKMENKRFFSFNFLTAFSHSKVNLIQVMDEALYNFLADLHQSGALRNVMLMVFGDHGQRFDTLRTTLLGRVEEQMPFLAVSLPPYLREKRPYLQEGLLANRETLIGWFDVYEMLADIAFDNMGPTPLVKRYGTIGYSLFRPIPKTRTCSEVGVQNWECVCAREMEVSSTSVDVKKAAHILVAHVNQLLEDSESAKDCTRLSLEGVVSAQTIVPSSYTSTIEDFSVMLRVSVRAAPSGALFEGVVERSAWEPRGHVVGTVQRINAYANQSYCVHHPRLRLYCFCRGFLAVSRENPSAT